MPLTVLILLRSGTLKHLISAYLHLEVVENDSSDSVETTFVFGSLL